MKPRTILNNRLLIVLLTAGLTVGLISWDYQQTPGQFEQSINDTIPKKPTRPSDGKHYDRDKKVRNLDDVLDELDAADMKINMENIQQELAEAMKSFDQEKIKFQIEKAMAQVDLAKIQQEVKESMAKVDFSKMQAELAEAMKSIDLAKIQKEVQESLAKVDWEKIKTEIEKEKNIDFKKVQDEMKELGPKMEMELKKAKIEIEKAKAEIKEYKTFTDGLESDGLINKKEGFTLKHKDGELFINGNKASQMTYTKYRSFLEKHKQFNIKINDNDFKLDID